MPYSPYSPLSSIIKSKTAKANTLGAYIIAINEYPVFTKKEVISYLVDLYQDNATSFTITFGKQNAYTTKEYNRALIDLELEAPSYNTPSPDVDLEEDHIPSISIDDLRRITAILNDDISYDDLLSIPILELEIAIDTITSTKTTPEEQTLGHFTRRKLKTLSNWKDWNEAEFRQLDRYVKLEMYGLPQFLPKNEKHILLRPHWQHHVKRSGI